MMLRSHALSTLSTLFGLAALAGCGKPTPPPNVLLITLDTVRADHLSCYGYERETTPNLDKLAKESVKFSRVFSQSSFTPPSHASIMTSRYPTSHGLLYWNTKLPQEVTTIAEHLRDQGYDTASFSPLAMSYQGLDQGFDKVVETGMYETQVDPETKYHVAPAPVVLGHFDEWLAQPREKPFFSWVHLYDAHRPYSVFAPDRKFCKVKEGRLGNHTSLDYQLDQKTRAERNIGHSQAQYIKNRYDSGLFGLDREVGKLLDKLKNDGVLDNTILVITSDHGEAFDEFEEYWFTHDHYLFDAVTHVPLFIRFPDGKFAGETVESMVQSIDITPTLLDYLGVAPIQLMQGHTLRPAIEDGIAVNELVSAERQGKSFDIVGDEIVPIPLDQYPFDRTLRNARQRLLFERMPKRYSLFNRENEETEQTDLYDESRPETAAMMKAYQKFVDQVEALKPTADLKNMSPEEIEHLRQLGYIQ